jgi:hypothetical protein
MLREFYKVAVRTDPIHTELRGAIGRLGASRSANKPVSYSLRSTSLARLLRLLALVSIPPLWSEIAVLHYRGSFHNRAMWAPVVTLPFILAGGVVSLLTPDERRSRNSFRPFALLMTMLGFIGTCFHLRGIKRQMGGFRNWEYNIITGPPFPAPMQIMFTGVLATAASASLKSDETQRLVRLVHLINIPSYLLFAFEASWNHWMSELFNDVMFVPIVLSPLLAVTHAASLKEPRTTRPWQLSLSALAVVAGLVGFGFHTRNISRKQGGFSWHNLFYGPPMAAPLQLTAQGIVGLLAAYYEDAE